MLTLYVKTGCPYCAAVLHKLDELDISFEEKNIADEAVAEELIAKGGKRQVPFLVDSERGTMLYESADINMYLDEHYAADSREQTSSEVKQQDGGVCEI